MGIDGKAIQNTLRENALMTCRSTPSKCIHIIESIETKGKAAINPPIIIDRFETSETNTISIVVIISLVIFQYISILPSVLCEFSENKI